MIYFYTLVTLLLSGFFSGIEIAFISASRLRIELKRQQGSRRGKILAGFVKKPSSFLGTTLVGNNIALVIFGILMEEIFRNVFFPSLAPDVTLSFSSLLGLTIISTGIVLMVGEFLPKILFRLNADRVLFALTYPLSIVRFLLTPFVWVMIRLAYFLLSLISGTRITNTQQVFTRLDLEHFIKDVQPDTDEGINKELFENALYLTNTKVKECMIPRPEIQSIEVTETVETLRATFTETKLSRIIVYEDSIDNILGYVHHQQLFQPVQDIRALVMPMPIVPEVTPARDLMNHFIKKHLSIACVVDDFGGTAGIITLEDIVEEIVGEIDDEYDHEDYIEQQISEREYLFSGRLEIDYLNEKYELELPEDESYHTLSGYIVTKTGSIPEQGKKIEIAPYHFILETVSETKIETIRVQHLPPPKDSK